MPMGTFRLHKTLTQLLFHLIPLKDAMKSQGQCQFLKGANSPKEGKSNIQD